ncbi:vitamin K epoxide reductase family protein [Mucilaginibacter xinganensis]|uniref:Vitamin K epoxide reductase family protein n=1 Tax=Mucilaginibacter xinganensis TaxID=1234841 RepID=A0A223NU69_9SPHI|nr:vitamin K epoxide reductase family protein [Mucilaginibacter xinganensis]ASU33376.1 Vitamin K epoxide reductase family protein [Mucilaginibacter xinganensis]
MEKNVVETIRSLIAILNIPVTKTSIINEVNENPNNENLFGISEVLSKWNITNAAYHLSPAELDNDFCPFIAYISKGIKEYEFVVVKTIDDKEVTICNENYKNKVIERGEFNKLYNNTALVVEPEENAGEINYKANRQKEIAESLKVPLFILGAVLLLSGFFIQNRAFSWYNCLLLLLKSGGLTTAVLLLVQSIQSDNPYVKTLCFKGKHADCDEILTSRAAKLVSWLSWSEIGGFYFGGTFLLLLFSYTTPGVPETLAVLSAACLPYIVYSLSYQAFIAKKWCVLCTTVQAVLLAEFFANLSNFSNPLNHLTTVGFYRITISMLMPVLAWIVVKPLFKRSGELNAARKTLAKFKHNDELFKKVLSEQPSYNQPNQDFSIVLGNPASKNIVTIVSNPYCGPCSTAHKALDEWLAVSDDLQVRVVLTNTPQSSEAARHLVALNNTGDAELVKQALHDWYKQSKKDYPSWAKKYPADLDSVACDNVLRKQNEWCESVDVRFTPLVILNGHQLPESYVIEDLKYLI